jgi:hypothetical protein
MHLTREMICTAALLVLFTFAALDAGVLAWSASVISGRQLTAELLTFFTVMGGAIATVWRMRS